MCVYIVGLLGLMIRYQNMSNWHIECIHVIDVYAGSPAAAAGLQSNDDYMLGTANLVFRGYQQLDLWLDENQDRPSNIYVFNAKRHSIRMVTIKPTRTWSTGLANTSPVNNSSLGADVGVGYLHALPIDSKRDVIVESNVYAPTPVTQSQVNDLPVTGLHEQINDDATNTSQTMIHPAVLHERTDNGQSTESTTSPAFKPIPTTFVPTSAQQFTQHEQQSNNDQQQSHLPHNAHFNSIELQQSVHSTTQNTQQPYRPPTTETESGMSASALM